MGNPVCLHSGLLDRFRDQKGVPERLFKISHNSFSVPLDANTYETVFGEGHEEGDVMKRVMKRGIKMG